LNFAVRCDELVAEASRNSDLVAALGATAAQDGGTGLGGHANEKAVNLATAAAIGLEGALRHDEILSVKKVVCLASEYNQLAASNRLPNCMAYTV
jgi:hypothetical protein